MGLVLVGLVQHWEQKNTPEEFSEDPNVKNAKTLKS